MSSMNFSTAKQVVRPPQRGIFPLDHDAECKAKMELYLNCMKDAKDTHHICRDFSKDYLQCRMENQLMSKENLDNLGFSKDKEVVGATEYDKSKEKAGYTAGKHISKKSEWWFNRSKKDWSFGGGGADAGSGEGGDGNSGAAGTSSSGSS